MSVLFFFFHKLNIALWIARSGQLEAKLGRIFQMKPTLPTGKWTSRIKICRSFHYFATPSRFIAEVPMI